MSSHTESDKKECRLQFSSYDPQILPHDVYKKKESGCPGIADVVLTEGGAWGYGVQVPVDWAGGPKIRHDAVPPATDIERLLA